MNCEVDQSQLTAYVDQQLAEDEWKRVDTHLETCIHCRQIVLGLQRTTEELDHYFGDVFVPFGFEDEVMQRLKATHQIRHMNRLSAIYLICAGIGIGLGAFIALMVSPLGAIMGVILHTLFILVHGISLLPMSLGYGWFVVFALSSIGFAATSFFGLRWLLQTLTSEVIL